MERNIPYLAVGIVFLLFIVALFAFATWQAGRYQTQDLEHYTIQFEGGVSGLSKGGDVRYRGVEVGRVVDIRLQEENPETIRVDIEVRPSTPVTANTLAQVLPQGITGLSYIELTTDSPGPPPKEPPGERYPLIDAKPAPLERIMNELPKVMRQVGRIAHRVERVLSEENIHHFQRILANAAKLSSDLNRLSAQAPKRMAQSAKLLERTSEMMERLNRVLGEMDAAVGEARIALHRGGELVPKLKQTLSQVSAFSRRLNRLIAKHEGNLDRFAGEGLQELHLLLEEGRKSLSEIRLLIRDLHRNPSQVVYPARQEGMEIPQ